MSDHAVTSMLEDEHNNTSCSSLPKTAVSLNSVTIFKVHSLQYYTDAGTYKVLHRKIVFMRMRITATSHGVLAVPYDDLASGDHTSSSRGNRKTSTSRLSRRRLAAGTRRRRLATTRRRLAATVRHRRPVPLTSTSGGHTSTSGER